MGIWEATSSGTQPEDAPLLQTTVTGAPNGTYDVYVFYRTQPSAPDDWSIRAGLSPTTLNLYNRTGDHGGTAGLLPFTGANALTFAPGTAPEEDPQQPMRYANLGPVTVTDGTFSVFVDDYPTLSLGEGMAPLNFRTWYDGIGYDVDPASFYDDSVMTGPAEIGTTWTSGNPPAAGTLNRIVDNHVVTLSSNFLGESLTVTSGATVNYAASGVVVNSLIVEPGGMLTETAAGSEFALGDLFAPPLGQLTLDGTASFDVPASGNLYLDMNITGTGSLDINAGDGADVWLTSAGNFAGTIRFNGSGDEVRLTETTSTGISDFLEMNSTGGNTLYFNAAFETGGGTVIFNEPGRIDHAATSTTPLRRLHGVANLVANAEVTIDLSKGFPNDGAQTEERRFLVGTAISGDADIIIQGTPVDYSNGSNITLNEFEVGATGEPANLAASDYSGTMTANDFVALEIRKHFPNARFVINSGAQLEMGNQPTSANPAPALSAHSLQMGEVVINAGGTLEIGFEQATNAGVPGHHPYKLTLTSDGTREGSLTMADGATLRIQINDVASTGQFDSIVADGNVMLDGTLNVLVNPPATNGTNPTWAPVVGQTFDIITIAPSSPAGDYDGSGTVDELDYLVWKGGYGSTTNLAADGNGDSVVDAADYLVWRNNQGATGVPLGSITGTFDNVTVTDFDGAFSGFGFQVNYSATAVQLEVVAAGALMVAQVPEPSTVAMASAALLGVMLSRRRRNTPGVAV